MNPIEVSQAIKDTLVSYLTTSFDVNRDGKEPDLASALRESFVTPGALVNGPFLELTPPYRTSNTLEELANENVISHELLNLSCFQHGKPIPTNVPLYTHQERSIRNLCQFDRNIVVSSGTGSGKTECFLIPILNDLLLDPSPGVRSVIIYPLNALVNDQLDRLRVLLAGTDITFGRYTGELQQTRHDALANFPGTPLPNEIICRDEIQKEGRIPQILVTNYAMLEYLLLRPDDAPLFNEGSWKYIVLDEAHTYGGAQGIEVSMLLRRLKHRLGHEPGETRCIATSATLTTDDQDAAAEFAHTLFGEDFEPDDIIFGEVDTNYFEAATNKQSVTPEIYLHDEFGEIITDIRSMAQRTVDIALRMHDIGLINEKELSLADLFEDDPQAYLFEVMRNNYDLIALRDWMAEQTGPVSVQSAADHLFNLDAPSDRAQALYHLIELGSMARPDADSVSLFPARYHLFARPPEGVWVCVNPECSGRQHNQSKWSRVFATRRERCDACESFVYSLVVCRTCGQPYVRTEKQGNGHLPEGNQEENPTPHYFTWSPIAEDQALGDDDEIDFDASPSGAPKLLQEETVICLNCGKAPSACTCEGERKLVNLHLVVENQTSKNRTRMVPVSELNECPRCLSKSYAGTEIATPISVGTRAPLSLVTEELYRYLPVSAKPEIADKPGGGRKLLSFYDSRQGAAQHAAYMQDVVNSEVYRYLIPVAIRAFYERKHRAPDLFELTREVTDMGLDLGVFHSNPELQEELRETRNLSSAQRERIEEYVIAYIVAEFTTRRRARQSLESLGIVSVHYFEEDNPPVLSGISGATGLTDEQVLTLIKYLLDDLRKNKTIVLPHGVARDAEVFGQNRVNPVIVRGEPNYQKSEVAWLGKTERHSRYQLVERVLARITGTTPPRNAVEDVMHHLFDWLSNRDTGLMVGVDAGYHLRNDRLFFSVADEWYRCSRCRRLSPHGPELVCPHPHCDGELLPLDDTWNLDNFNRRALTREIIPMRVEEHTAQLSARRGREYQEAFKQGDINMLSCSTTFEMGIDLGDLQAVVLSNIPPTVANYKQRAGRAGRRVSGTAFILSWASLRPHDQTYFNDPAGIISGNVRVPHIAISNDLILRRHTNAILLSVYLRYRLAAGHEDLLRVGPFFDTNGVEPPHYSGIEAWISNRQSELLDSVHAFLAWLGDSDYDAAEAVIEHFHQKMRDEANAHYQQIMALYRNAINDLAQVLMQDNSAAVIEDMRWYQNLIGRLQDKYLINWLSERGVLPSYSFPLYTVELFIPPDKHSDLELQRDIRQAIREYAPGQEVVADKRIWKSNGVRFHRETPQRHHYRICEYCNHVRVGKDVGIPLHDHDGLCPVCGQPPSKLNRRVFQYLEPDGFRTSNDSGKPAGQYVKREIAQMKSALIPSDTAELTELNDIISLSYERDGTILHVNEGSRGGGFRICMTCGRRLSKNAKSCTGTYRGQKCPGTQIETLNLGFREKTDTLRLVFNSTDAFTVPGPTDLSFWLSLMYALLQGASRALQIERRDIDGVLQPRAVDGGWAQTIVLYDNVPGGAGHVRQIETELIAVISEAIRITNCVNCAPDSSCYQCLRDYSNQYYHGKLKRGPVSRFLEVLKNSLENDDLAINGIGNVLALNLPLWTLQQVTNSQDVVYIMADSIDQSRPMGSSYSWLDVLQDLTRRGVEVHLGLMNPPFPDRLNPATLSTAQHMQLLINQGVHVYNMESTPEWRIVIDPGLRYERALRPNGNVLVLGEYTGSTGLSTSIRNEVVQEAYQQIMGLPIIELSSDDFTSPSDISVINIDHYYRGKTDQDILGWVFNEPIVEMVINDRYLYDYYHAYHRVKPFLAMADAYEQLQRVTVYTQRAESGSVCGSRYDQDRALQRLQKEHSNTDVRFVYSKAEHDRYIIITRTNGTQARLIFGIGLDYINTDGSINPTYIVVEDPYLE